MGLQDEIMRKNKSKEQGFEPDSKLTANHFPVL